MHRTRLIGLVSAAVLAAACGTSLARPPVGTEFTYQGQLLKAGQALTGNADFRFTLFDGPGPAANVVGTIQNVANIPVDQGRFECAVNFGESPYTTNEERWMQVEVRNPSGIGNFSLMGDRQKLTASPFSLATRGINVDAAGNVWVGGSVGVGGTMDTGAFRVGGSRSTHTQGAHLEWNKTGGDGATWLLNQRGLGGGGFIFGEVNDLDTVTERMRIDGAGNVGIGTNSPLLRLDVADGSTIGSSFAIGSNVSQDPANRGTKVGFGWAFNDNCGPNFTGMRVDVVQVVGGTCSNGNSFDLAFWTGACGVACPREVMRINGRGNVGIGTATPTRGKLEVVGTFGVNNGAATHAFLIPSGVGPNAGVLPNIPVSIYTSGDIHAPVFRAFSDARIKNIQGRSDGVKDLNTLLDVEITDYTFKDTIAKGTEAQKKVIGQQLEQVYPLAVRKTSDIIPDIYKKAPVQGGWVMLGTDLKVGDKVRVIGMDAQTESTVAEVKDGAFRVADLPAGDEVFVYGREVSDFRTVDYEAIAMLNVSATQELARQNMAQQKRIEELESQRASVEARLAKLEAALADKSAATASK